MRRCSPHGSRVAPALWLFFLAGSAHAQSTAEREADRLFNEGNQLVARGAYREACPKLERSQELDPGVGTQFNLANCYERTERPARAYKLFREVERIARAAGKHERAEASHQRAEALAPKVPQLRFVLKEPPHDLVLKVDGEPVAKPNDPVLVDPGAHEAMASAPGKRTWTSAVNVTQDAHVIDVTIPRLEDEPMATPATPVPRAAEGHHDANAAPAKTHHGSTQRTLALVTAGIGIVGLGVGTYFGLRSKSDHDDAKNVCPNRDACGSMDGVSKWSDATSKGTVSTVAFAVGGAALIAGGILWFTAPRGPAAKTTRVRVVPSLAANQAGIVVSGGFM